jgi:hypothetical protein
VSERVADRDRQGAKTDPSMAPIPARTCSRPWNAGKAGKRWSQVDIEETSGRIFIALTSRTHFSLNAAKSGDLEIVCADEKDVISKGLYLPELSAAS